MKTFLTIILESSAAMALFYLVFWFFLRKETFFRINRYYLVIALLLSLLLPLFPITYTVWSDPSGLAKGNATLQQLSSARLSPGSQLSYEVPLRITLAIYLAGAFMVLLRLILQTGNIARTVRKSEIIHKDNLTLVKNDRYDLPFSFFNLVFYNPDLHRQEDLPGILAHEKVHIREQHWVDLIIAELWSVLFWFNPFVWLFERSIKQNHEFLADAGVLAQGHSIGGYQALLINQLMGVPVAGFTNHLSFSFNTTRFKMMSNNEKKRKRVFRLVWAIPVIALLLVAFAEPDYKSRTPAGNQGNGAVSAPQKISAIKITGAIVKPDGTPLEGTSIILGGTTTGTVSKADGTFELMIPANQSANLVFSYVGYVTKVMKVEPSDKDLKLKTNQMVEAVINIGEKYSNQKVPPPPPPPPSSGSEKVQKGVESAEKAGIPPPPPPPPPPPSTTGTYKGNKIVEESAGGGKEPFVMVEEMPTYPGGSEALDKYVQEMCQKTAQAKNLKGNAIVQFTVNEEGKVTDVKAGKRDNDEVAKAAVVIISGLKQWKPGAQHGKPVPVKYALELKF